MADSTKTTPPDSEHFDILIIGAGISGIGAAFYFQRDHPTKSFALLEARDAIGGTWDLFRYPGIRSDSDIQTFGYEFKPWKGDSSIVAGEEILSYLQETVEELGIESKIRLRHKVLGARWSTAEARWTLDVERSDDDEVIQMSCNWLFCASGYFRYDQGYSPAFKGANRFAGEVVHPQFWPEDLDYADKRIVVIGSGATAVTLVPALSKDAAHVTMLQRTPTYILPLAAVDKFALLASRILPAPLAHRLARKKNIAIQDLLWSFSRRFPRQARRIIRRMNLAYLPRGYPVDEHFNPPYDPWSQRLCIVPDGDLFHALSTGRADIVTEHIETFTEAGIELRSGQHLDADIIITATGLRLLPVGGIELHVGDEAVHLPDRFIFRGLMLSGVPNFSLIFGYTNASWTLKVGPACEYICRTLEYMDAGGYAVCRPELSDHPMDAHPLLDFEAGYIQRSLAELPCQGDRPPWRMATKYKTDVKRLRRGPVTHPNLRFERSPPQRGL